MRRVISGILVAALLLGLVGMIAFTAFAEELTPDLSVQTPDYGAGAAANLDGITVSVGTVNAEQSHWWRETGEGSEAFTGTMEEGQYYWLNLIVNAEPGTFDSDMVIFVNGAVHEGGWGVSGDGDYIEIDIHVDMRPKQAEWAELGGMPDEIQAGAAEAPALTVVEGQMSVVAARWVDAQKQPVTAFEEGKIYYLEIELAPAEGCEFREWFDVYGMYGSAETQIVNAGKALAWVRYSLMPGVGKITLTTSGMASGKPVSNVKAQVTGNATLAEIRIYNVTDEEMVESGNFAAGKNYQITYVLKAKQGYEFGKDMEIDCNGNTGMEWNYDDQFLYLTEYFSTCKKITKAEVTVTAPKVGAKVDAAKVTVPKGANYTATIQWIDMENYEPATGTFQKGHAYQLCVDLEPKEGYAFDRDMTVTINGKKRAYGGVSESGLYSWAYMEYSFKNQITKVELPALPESIKMGDILSADFVKNGKNYTVEATWAILDEGEVSKVEKNGSYVLMLIASANEGYEFASDAVITVGGKKFAGALNYGNEIVVYKNYNIGMKEISRIDLTVPAPNKGNEPQKPTFGKDVHFTCAEAQWMMNETGNVMDDSEDVRTFTVGQYHFLTLMLQPEEGYAFADDVAVYVNGKKVKVAADMNMGALNVLALSFGKLGKPDNADTADTMPVALWLCVGTLALCGLAVTVASKKKYCA